MNASIPVPVFLEPTVRHVIKTPGQAGPGRPIVMPGLGAMWPRVTAHTIGTFVTAIGLSLVFLVVAPIVLGYRPVAVVSGSMAPALQASDVVMLQEPTDPLVVGAVVDFQRGDDRRIHRIVEVGSLGYRTKGDANPTVDSDIVEPADVNGVGVMVVPFVGAPQLWLEQGRWPNLAALLVAIIAASWVTPRRWLASATPHVAVLSPTR